MFYNDLCKRSELRYSPASIQGYSARVVNIVNRSRPWLTSSLLKKQGWQAPYWKKGEAPVWCLHTLMWLSSGVQSIWDAEKVYGRHTVSRFLRSRQENINNWKFESSWYEQYKRHPFFSISGVYKQHPAFRLETECQTGAPSKRVPDRCPVYCPICIALNPSIEYILGFSCMRV